MSFKPSDTFTAEFDTCSSTGALTNADSLPTGILSKNGTDDGTVTVTVTNKATGRYKAVCTIPSGYASGDRIVMHVAATISTIAAGVTIGPYVLDSKRFSDVVGTLIPAITPGNAGGLVITDANGNVPTYQSRFLGYTPEDTGAVITGGTGTFSVLLDGSSTPKAGDLLIATSGSSNKQSAWITSVVGTAVFRLSVSPANLTVISGDTVALWTPVSPVDGAQIQGPVQAAMTAQGLTSTRAGKLDNLSGDSFTRLGAPVGVSVSADIAAIKTDTAADNVDIVTALGDLVTLLARTDPSTAIAAVKAVTDKLAMMINESDQFTESALINAPNGGGTINVGSVTVNWNYGGNDFRVLRSDGVTGATGVQVFAYVASEYASNPNTAVVRGYAVTNDSGQWSGMKLSSTVTYTLVADPNDGGGAKITNLTV